MPSRLLNHPKNVTKEMVRASINREFSPQERPFESEAGYGWRVEKHRFSMLVGKDEGVVSFFIKTFDRKLLERSESE